MSSWQVKNEWEQVLKDNALGTFDEALAYAGGKLLSRKSTSQTWRCVLSDGRTVFVKQDQGSPLRAAIRSLLKFRKPLPATGRERLRIEAMRRLGYHVPEIVAYGESRRWGLPDKAVMISLPVAGRSVDEQFRDASIGAERRQELTKLCLGVLETMQQAGCDWLKDCKPEHFFVTDDNCVSLIDVERMHFRGHALAEEVCQRQRERFLSLLPK